MGLSSQKELKLFNNSKNIVKFKWKLYRSYSEDKARSEKLEGGFEFMKENEKVKSRKLEEYGIIDHKGHCMVYERIYEDELEEFECTDKFLYSHPNFQIIPLVIIY